MKILVCGGRDYQDKYRVQKELDKIIGYAELWDDRKLLPKNITIIHGGAPGADTWADHWAVHNQTNIEEYKADWGRHGKAAGPIRNEKMLKEGNPDLVVAFPGGKGTAHMVKIAKENNFHVIEIQEYKND